MEIKVTHMRNTSLFRMLEILRNKLAYQIFVDIDKVFYDLVSGDLVYLIKSLGTCYILVYMLIYVDLSDH